MHLLRAAARTCPHALFGHPATQDCAFNPLAITTTLLFGLLNTAVSISKVAEHGSLLCSALIFLYSVWLCYSAVAAIPDAACNPLQILHAEEGSSTHTFLLIVSLFVAGGSCAYFAYRMGSREIGRNAMTGGASKAPAMTDGAVSGGGAAAHDQVTVNVKDDNSATGSSTSGEDVVAASWAHYYIRMLIITMYMAMLLTDWGVAAEVSGESDEGVPTSIGSASRPYSVGYASAWLQLGTNWLCNLLYLWTLVAPKLFPDRDFS